MHIFIHATDSGKAVKLYDKYASKYACDGFLELSEGAVNLEVTSPDGEEGLVDILKGETVPPNTYSKTNYAVKSGETIFISDGQD